MGNSECPLTQTCKNEICLPCHVAENAECSVRNHRRICMCVPGYTGDPYGIGCISYNEPRKPYRDYRQKGKFKFLHQGACAISPPFDFHPFDAPHTSQKTIEDCASECISRIGVKYFTYKPRSNENLFTCACYVRECKLDERYVDYKAYEIQRLSGPPY